LNRAARAARSLRPARRIKQFGAEAHREADRGVLRIDPARRLSPRAGGVRYNACFIDARDSVEDAMAKGQMRSWKEKKKPKADQNKKKKGGPTPSPFAAAQAQAKAAAGKKA
jgi:hypothetical protein